MSFLDAAEHLIKCQYIPIESKADRMPTDKSGFSLPLPAPPNIHVQGYLGLRGIDPLVISHCIKEGIVYETSNKNKPRVVFVGRDPDGKAHYAAVRDCGGDFKG